MPDTPPAPPPRVSKRAGTMHATVCPHDCPSVCALEVEKLDERTIGRVNGAEANSYTAGVVCAKVARYAERIHHPDRLMKPLRRVGPKGSRQFAEISWADALDIVAVFHRVLGLVRERLSVYTSHWQYGGAAWGRADNAT